MATAGKKVGTITHYYNKIGVGIIKLEGEVKVGDRLKFEGHETAFEQPITEMQFDHKAITVGKKGQEIGIKLGARVKEKDVVYLISP